MTYDKMSQIERIVCSCVNHAIKQRNPEYKKTVTRKTLYAGVTKADTCVLIARQLCYLVLHDNYGVSYSTISAHAGISLRRIMSGIDKARRLSFTDDLYCGIREQIYRKIGLETQ